jgi:hypothetical protein
MKAIKSLKSLNCGELRVLRLLIAVPAAILLLLLLLLPLLLRRRRLRRRRLPLTRAAPSVQVVRSKLELPQGAAGSPSEDVTYAASPGFRDGTSLGSRDLEAAVMGSPDLDAAGAITSVNGHAISPAPHDPPHSSALPVRYPGGAAGPLAPRVPFAQSVLHSQVRAPPSSLSAPTLFFVRTPPSSLSAPHPPL